MIWISLILCWYVIISIAFFSWHCGITPTPSTPFIKSLLHSGLELKDGEILELGCGFGGIAVHLAKQFPKRKVVGYELSPIPYSIAKLRSLFYPNLQIQRKNFFDVDHRKAALIYCYLYRKGMSRLQEKWEKELSNKALIFTNTFTLPNREYSELLKLDDLFQTCVYVYIF